MASEITPQESAPSPSEPPLILAFTGRLSRVRYLLWTSIPGNLSLAMLWYLYQTPSPSGVLVLAAWAPMVFASWVYGVRRVMDIGWHWWLFGLTFVPLVGTVFVFMLLGTPGTKGNNRYGPQPEPASKKEALLLLASLVMFVSLCIMFFSSEAGRRFLLAL